MPFPERERLEKYHLHGRGLKAFVAEIVILFLKRSVLQRWDH